MAELPCGTVSPGPPFAVETASGCVSRSSGCYGFEVYSSMDYAACKK